MKCYIKNYPRPQFVRSSWTDLNGSWDFSFDDENLGEKSDWFNAFPKAKTITVPFTYETKMSGIQDETPHNNVWYNRNITVSESDLQKIVMLHFEGSDYTTKLWVNGKFAGTHTGAYARFSFDITNLLSAGDNTITVKAEDSFDLQQPRGKQRWIKDNFACWYVQTTGIWKSVWMETKAKSSIDHMKLTPVLSEQKVNFEFDVDSTKYGPNLTLEASVSFKDTFVNKVIIPVTKKHIETSINVACVDVFEWEIKTWTPDHPDLYDLTLTLRDGNEVVDTVGSYFGMRDIRVEGTNVLLNGEPYYQRLILDQGYWKDSHLTPPSEDVLIEDIEKIRALGYNGLRKHQKVEDEKFIYWCDVMGMLVWSEVGSAYQFSDYAVTEFTTQWMEIVKQNYNHPSIITWTPFNETWGIGFIKTDKRKQSFTEAIYHLTKTYDPNRPVITNDGWEHTVSDIVTLHDYESDGDIFFEKYASMQEEMLDNSLYHNRFKSAYANGYKYGGQPIIISEFGGIAFNNDDAGWGYGEKVQTEEDFIKRFDSITTAVKELPNCCGFCYTQVTDVQQEINGLMDIDRNFKINPEIIKEINERPVNILVHDIPNK